MAQAALAPPDDLIEPPADLQDAGPPLASAYPSGMVEPGTENPFDYSKYPKVKNPDGSFSNVKTFSTNIDGKEVLLPSMVGGKNLVRVKPDRSIDYSQAIDHYRKTGEHFGKFDTPENADAFANQVEQRMQGEAPPDDLVSPPDDLVAQPTSPASLTALAAPGNSALENMPGYGSKIRAIEQFGGGPGSSAAGAFVRGAERSAAPSAAGMLAFGAGAQAGGIGGAALGALTGPLAPIAVPVLGTAGALVGGVGASMGASTLVGKAQDWLISKLPDDLVKSIGQDAAQQQADVEKHKYAYAAGELAPNLAMIRPSFASLPPWEEGTALWRRLFGHPVTARVAGAGITAGQEATEEKLRGEDLDPAMIALAGGAGALMNKPTRAGAALMAAGAAPVRYAAGRFRGRGAGPGAPPGTEPPEGGPGGAGEPVEGTYQDITPGRKPPKQIASRSAAPAPDEEIGLRDPGGGPPQAVTILGTFQDGRYTTVKYADGRTKDFPTDYLIKNLTDPPKPAPPPAAAPAPAAEPPIAQEGAPVSEDERFNVPPPDLVDPETGEITTPELAQPEREPGADIGEEEPPEPFRTTPGKIATEHAADVSAIEAQAFKDASEKRAAQPEQPAITDVGTRATPVRAPETAEDIQPARDQTAQPKSPAQAEANNYKQGHIANLHGMDIAIETPKGEARSGVGSHGQEWSNVNNLADYGRIKGTKGSDHEHVDVYIGPNPKSEKAYVIDQVDQNGAFDEHKAVLGADSPQQAVAIYDDGFSDGSGPARRRNVKEMPVSEFRDWVNSPGSRKAIGPQPVGENVTRETAPIAAPTTRPLDDHKNPIFNKGERVVLGGDDPYGGRHGTVTEANGLVMAPIFGGNRSTTYHYRVKTDEGAETFANKLTEETEKPAKVVPDPVIDGHATPPWEVQHSIDYAKKSAKDQHAMAGRSRKRQNRDAHLRSAAESEKKAAKYQAVLDAWKKENPAAAAKHFPEAKALPAPVAPAQPSPPSAGASYAENEGHDGVEVRFKARPDDAIIGRLKSAGFRWSSKQKLWYAKRTPKTLDLAKDLAGEKPVTTGAPAAAPSEIGKPSLSGTVNDRAAFRGALMSPVGEAQWGGKTYRIERYRSEGGLAMRYAVKVADTSTKHFVTDGDTHGNRDEAVQHAFELAFGEPAAPKPKVPQGTLAPEKPTFPIDNVSSRRTQGTETPFGKYKGYASTNEGGRLSVDAYGETAEDAQRAAVEKLKQEFSERQTERTAAPTEPRGPRVLINVVGADGLTNAERADKMSKMRKDLERIGATRIGNVDYSIQSTERGGRTMYFVRRTENGIRTEMGGVFHQGGWSRDKAIQEAVEDAFPKREPTVETPTARVETQAAEEGGRAELDNDIYQPGNMPETTAIPPEPKVSDFKRGDQVDLKPEYAWMGSGGRDKNRIVTDVSPDGRFVTLDGGAKFEASYLLPAGSPISYPPGLLPGTETPTLPTEEGHGLQEPVRPGTPGERPEAVHGIAPNEQNRPVSSGEGQGGARPTPSTPGIGTAGAGRPTQRPAGPTAGGGAGLGPNAGLPRPGEGPEPGTAGRPPDADVQGTNYRIEPGEIGEDRGPKAKALDNIAAIELVKRLQAENRLATREEQAVLAKYVGWGGLSGVFRNSQGKFGTGFEDVGRRLEGLLTPEEHATAARSTQYAHYTAEHVIRSMWDAVARMGFKGGSVFEPGMGIGHFLGMMPPDIAARSEYQGVEMDHLTADIAKLLYPESGVRQADFTQLPLPENSFDLAIGNPPFGDIVIKADPKYAARKFMLHDYFFAKSLDSVRPGGLLAFVTSAGTMNKLDNAARSYLGQRAKFLGGVRLPSTAFKKNAGTEVTTDILFFQKRDEPIAPKDYDKMFGANDPEAIWGDTVTRELPDDAGAMGPVAVSRYFSDHPNLVLGKEGRFDKLYKGRYGVHALPGADLPADLPKALDAALPKDIYKPPESQEEKVEKDYASPETKDGSYYIKDGDLMQYSGGVGKPVPGRGKGITGGVSKESRARIVHLIPVRDALRDVYRADLADNAQDGDVARQNLNRHYDTFVEKFGPINKAEITYQRPRIAQQEVARARFREEVIAHGEQRWDEGDFDATPHYQFLNVEDEDEDGDELLEPATKKEKKERLTWSKLAKMRLEARLKAKAEGKTFNEGSFDPAEMPDVAIIKRPNLDPFMADEESYNLSAIEDYDSATGTATKRRIFFENVLTRDTEPDIKSADDAVLWSLNKFGRFDVDAITKKTGRKSADLIADLGDKVFRVPGTVNTYETADEYLSGDVVDKLETAKKYAASDPEMERNVKALEAARPAPLAPSEVHVRFGMPWIPRDFMQEFVRDVLNLGDVDIKHSDVLGGWTVRGNQGDAPDFARWSSEGGYDAFDVLGEALNGTKPRIYETIRGPNGTERVFDPIATQSVADRIDEMSNAFAESAEDTGELIGGWIYDNEAKRQQLVDYYNETANRTVQRHWDGAYLTTPGVAADWSWRPHQRRGVARVIQSGNTYVAHAVGAGKTSLYIGAGMEMRRLGLVNKPMYVVPNSMLGQFTKEFYQQYPTAKIMVADERRFHTDRRKQFIANAAQQDVDAIIITHSSFGKIPMSAEFQSQMIQEEIDAVREALDGLDKQEDRITIKKLENKLEKLEQRLRGAFSSQKDKTLTFEQMGVDFLFIDEAHMFRKLDFASRQNIKGIDGNGSDRAFDLYSKVRYLNGKKPGRSVVMGSGTPITNTMGELYTLSKYMQPEALQKRGIAHFDSWASNFGKVKVATEPTPQGTYDRVARFSSFVNAYDLYRMVSEVMDIVTPAQLEQYVVRPKVAGGARKLNIAPLTDALENYRQQIADRVEAIKQRRGPPQKGDDILLSVINDARHAALDLRFVEQSQNDEKSKLNTMLANVVAIYNRTGNQTFYDPGTQYQKAIAKGAATQMIFSNLGVNSRGPMDFSGYRWMKRYLIQNGIPEKEIAIIGDYKNSTARQRLFNDMNAGKIRILIGSTQKMGMGVNAQRRLYAIHNLDPLWYPSDDEQRVGRILRQGNWNPEIEIHDYGTKGTYDEQMWQMMGRKARFVEQFFRGDPTLRFLPDIGEASIYEQASAIAASDERVIRVTELKHELNRLERQSAAHDREQQSYRSKINQAQGDIAYANKAIPKYEADIAKRVPTRGDAFAMRVGDKTYTKRAEAEEALGKDIERLSALKTKGRPETVGDLGGFRVLMAPDLIAKDKGGVNIYIRLTDGEIDQVRTTAITPGGMIRAVEDKLDSFESSIRYWERTRDEGTKVIASLQSQLGKTFGGRQQIIDLRREVRELENQISASGHGEEMPPTPPPITYSLLPGEEEVRRDLLGHYGELKADQKRRLQNYNWRRKNGKPLNSVADIDAALDENTQAQRAARISDSDFRENMRGLEARRREILTAPPDEGEAPQFQRIERNEPAPTFYSGLERAVSAIPQEKMGVGQWRNTIKNLPGVKKDEMDWLGLDDWLAPQKGTLDKSAILDFIKANNVQIKEVMKGGARDASSLFPEDVHDWTPEAATPADSYATGEPRSAVYHSGEATVELHWKKNGELKEVIAEWAGGPAQSFRDFIEAREWLIGESGAGGAEGTKFGTYTLPGGENYRELLLTLPEKTGGERGPKGWGDTAGGTMDTANFRSGHFDEPNILAHVRFNDRWTSADGTSYTPPQKVLFIEEIQSDWHQRGRRQGYKSGAEAADVERASSERSKAIDALAKEKVRITQEASGGRYASMGELLENGNAEMVRTLKRAEKSDAGYLAAERNYHEANQAWVTAGNRARLVVPDAPFKTTWQELAFKRMLRYAAENGYDKVAWTTGEQQADRYDLSKQVDHIDHRRNADGTYDVAAFRYRAPTARMGQEQIWHDDRATAQILEDNLGKDVADKIAKGEGEPVTLTGKANLRRLSGLDLKVGGEGMKGFYDKILPAFANKYAKKWGAKVGATTIETLRGTHGTESLTERVHSLPITPEMRESVMGGQPMFERTGLPTPSARPTVMQMGRGVYGEPVRAVTPEQRNLIGEVDKIAKRIAPTAPVRIARRLYARTAENPSFEEVHGAAYREGAVRAIAWSLESPNAAGTVRHEAVHYLRRQGLITPDEWEKLAKEAADSNWAESHHIDERYPGIKGDARTEEAVAEEFAKWNGAPDSVPPWVARIFARIRQFLRQIAAAARKAFGKDVTAHDIFAAMESGEVGARGEPEAANELVPQFQKPPTTAVEGAEALDDMATAAAGGGGDKDIGKAAASAAEGFPQKGRPSKHLSGLGGTVERLVIFPRTLAATDWRSAKYWSAIERKNDTAAKLLHEAADGSKQYVALAPEQRTKLHAAEELARLKGVVLDDDGHPIVMRSDLGMPREVFLRLDPRRMGNVLYDAGIKREDIDDIVTRIKDGDPVTIHRAVDQINPPLAHSKYGDVIDLDPQTTKAYFERRKLFQQRWRDLMSGAAKRAGWDGEPDAKVIREAAEKEDREAGKNKLYRIAALMDAMAEQERRGYVPLMRFGDYYLSVVPKAGIDKESLGGFPRTLEFRLVDSADSPFQGSTRRAGDVPKNATEAMKDLRKRYPESMYDIQHGYISHKPELLRSLDIPAIEKLLTVLGQKDTDLFGPMVEEIQNKMYEELTAGFKRRASNTPGYSNDFSRASGAYFHWTSRHVAEQLHGDDVRHAQEQYIDGHPDRGTRQFWQDWDADQKRPATWMQSLQQFGFYWELAGNLSSSVSIALHGPEVANFTLGIGLGASKTGVAVSAAKLFPALAQVEAAIRANTKEGLHIDIATIKGLAPDERAGLEASDKAGLFRSTAADELMGMQKGGFDDLSPEAQLWQRSLKVAASNISVVDRGNRIAIWLAAHRLAKTPGVLKKWNKVWWDNQLYREMIARDGLTPEGMARFMVDEAAFVWGKKNQPWLARKLPLIFQFQGFRMRWLSALFRNMHRMGPEGKLSGLAMMAGIWALAGMQGLPFVGDLEEGLEWLYKRLTKIDPMLEAKLYDMMGSSWFGKRGAEMVLKGAPRTVLGIDLSNRLGFGKIVTDMDLSTNPLEALGVVPGIIYNGVTQAANRWERGQRLGAVTPLLPAVVRNPYEGLVVYPNEGVRTQYQKPNEPPVVAPGQLNTGDIVARSLGYSPSPVARAYEERLFYERLAAAARAAAQGTKPPAPYRPPAQRVPQRARRPSPYPQ